MAIPVSVLITTKNEASCLARCLAALKDFDEVIVIDSHSHDETAHIAQRYDAQVVSFSWDGRYPKKRQWCLENVITKHSWIFFVDADEVLPPLLIAEIAQEMKAPRFDGYFVPGRYVIDGKVLRFGLRNRKLVLFKRDDFVYPVVDDLDIPGMGEMEGHYQPVKAPYKDQGAVRVGSLKQALYHCAYNSGEDWQSRHARYALWEAHMHMRKRWPIDPDYRREMMKRLFRALPMRGVIAFMHSYIYKLGFLDGRAGLALALDRYGYYSAVARAYRALKRL